MNCSVCRQPIDISVWHIVGTSDNGEQLRFVWAKDTEGWSAQSRVVVLGSNSCVRRYYTKNPECMSRLKELLKR